MLLEHSTRAILAKQETDYLPSLSSSAATRCLALPFTQSPKPYVYKVPSDHAPYEIDSRGARMAGDSQRVAIG